MLQDTTDHTVTHTYFKFKPDSTLTLLHSLIPEKARCDHVTHYHMTHWDQWTLKYRLHSQLWSQFSLGALGEFPRYLLL